MSCNIFAEMKVSPLLTLGELGLDRRATAIEAGAALARLAEAQIARWVQFPAGILFFTLVTGDPESGAFYVLDRKSGALYMLSFDDHHWGGYSLEDYQTLVHKYKLNRLAQCPRLLAERLRPMAVW